MDVKHLYLEDGAVNPELFAESFVIWGSGGDGAKYFSEWNGIYCKKERYTWFY